MSPFGDQLQSANVAIWQLGHVVCFSDVYYPILRHIANKGDNLNRRPVLANKPGNGKKIVFFFFILSFLKQVKSILGKIVAEWLLPAAL